MSDSLSPGRRRYVFGLAALINFFVFAAAMAAMPVLFAEIADEIGLNIIEIGAVWGLTSTAGVVSIIIGGMLADRYGTRRVLAVFCLGAGVFGALRGISGSLSELIITSLLFGVFAEAVPAIVIKSASQLFHGRGLGASQGFLTACVGGGMMAGAMVSATLLSPWLGGWQPVLYFYGGISVLLGILWYITVPLSASPAAAAAARPSFIRSFSHVARSRNVWLIGLAMMGFAGSNKGLMGYLPLFLRNGGWSNVAADASLAVYNAAGTIASVPLTLMSDRLGKRKTILIPALIISTLGIALIGYTSGASFWIIVIVTGIFRDMVWAMAATMTVESEGIGPASAGTAIGIVHAFTRFGYTYAPAAGNALASVAPGAPFLFWGGLCALGLVFFAAAKETGRSANSAAAP